MISVSLKRSYKSSKGNTVFVYAVSAKPEEVEQYKTASADYYREAEDGTPLWFTTRCIGQRGTLVITSKGKIVPDMSAFEQAASLQQPDNLTTRLIQQHPVANSWPLLHRQLEPAPGHWHLHRTIRAAQFQTAALYPENSCWLQRLRIFTLLQRQLLRKKM